MSDISKATSPSPSPSVPELHEINKMSDNLAWPITDEILIRAAQSSWRSKVYDHFSISIDRRIDTNGERSIWFKFSCRTDPANHLPQFRARQDTSSGTNNLQRGQNACRARHQGEESSGALPIAHEFSDTRLRALLALWCARNHRPFELVQDELFGAIVDELNPSVSLPDSTTISRDVKSIYHQNMDRIRRYFEHVDHVHLAIDGWTAPTSRSYLGLVVIWEAAGELHRAILEFIQLTNRHTGAYLAQRMTECLTKYELGRKLLSVCMDNAGNNNTFTQELQKLIPTFGGPEFRARCVAHILNLMAKAYLSVFSKPKSKRRETTSQDNATVLRLGDGEPAGEPEDAGDDTDSEAEAVAKDDIDEDKAAYDDMTVKESLAVAFAEIGNASKISIPQKERQAAQQLLPKITGLAKRAKKSPVVQQKFEQYVAAHPGLSSSAHPALTCSVSTRWNTELLAIRSHVQKRPAVKQLTADRDLSLKRFQLTEAQWALAEQLMSELKIFERLTLLFSETKVPLIHQVIPALWKLRDRLQATVERPTPKQHPLLRVAAQASIKVFDKYMRLFEESSLYWVALVMCPHKKLEWLRSRGYSESDIQRVEALVYSAFDKMTSNWSESNSEKVHYEDSMISEFNQSLADGWLSDDEIEYTRPTASQDTLETYLRTPLVPVEVLRQGGLLAYWHGQQKAMPRVSKFALGILGSPASSVDAERAFSGGRLTIGHLQHSMGDTTFEAKMAVGSWFDTPLLPSVDVADTIVKGKGRH